MVEIRIDRARGNRRARPGLGRAAALAISIYCALVTRDFRHGVILAVNHDGDSDSTGSITGNLLGTLLGVEALPGEWAARSGAARRRRRGRHGSLCVPLVEGERVAEGIRTSGSRRNMRESSGRPQRRNPEKARSRPGAGPKVPVRLGPT